MSSQFRSPVTILKYTVLCAAALSLSACSWFGGGDDDLKPAELVDFSPSQKVEKLWSHDVGDGTELIGIRLTPAYASGRVYAASVDGNIKSLDAVNGKVVWENETELPLTAGVGLDGNTLVVASEEGDVLAFSAQDGSQMWRSKVSSEVLATPVIHQGMVIIRVQDGRVFGFDVSSGERRWAYDRSIPLLTLRGNSDPVPLDGLAFMGYDSGHLVALRVTDGMLAWEEVVSNPSGRTELERMVDVDGQIALTNSEIYAVSFQGRLAAFTANGGRKLWVKDLSSYTGVTVGPNSLFVTDVDDSVWSMDRASGGTLWKLDSLARRDLGLPVRHASTIVVGDAMGYLHWIDPESGDFVARSRVDDEPIVAAPVVIGDTLFALSRGGELAAFRIGALAN